MNNINKPLYSRSETDLKLALKKYKYGGEEKGYDASNEEIKRILALYAEYEKNFAKESEKLKPDDLSEALQTALFTAYSYTQKTRKLEHIRQTIFANISVCPLCGIDVPTELDHFLPISEFNALAIFVHNLIPLCHICNNTKRADLPSKKSGRYLHSYFDIIPKVEYLYAKVDLSGGALTVEFSINSALVDDDSLIVNLQYQLDKLNINNRYMAEINKYLSSYAVPLHMLYTSTNAENVKNYLDIQARHEARATHAAHWRPTLLRALKAHAEFCDGGFYQILHVDKELAVEVASLIGSR